MIGTTGTQRIVATPAAGALWMAVQKLVASEYDLCGELSNSPDGRRVVYVAAQRGTASALRLLVIERVPDASRSKSLDSYEVAIHDTLDETIPARDLSCHQCTKPLATWSALCPHCGRDAAPAAVPRADWSRAIAQPAVTTAFGHEPTPLGELPTAAGSIVAVVREEETGEVFVVEFDRARETDGPTRAVPIGLLTRPAGAPSQHRRSSPFSGEIGPLAAGEHGLVTGVAGSEKAANAIDAPLVCPKCRSRYERDVRFCPVDGAELSPVQEPVDLVGRVLSGKFRVLKLLGEGGMGRVYLAEHVRIGRRCALKVLSPTLVGHPDAIRRFDGEARNASRIAHPNVATVYDFEETPEGLVFIVLEFIDGETLGAVVAREVWLDVRRAVRIARDTAIALQAAHDLGIVHRDLKPDNIMIARTANGDDLVKVVDFGIAKAAEGLGNNSKVTRTGFVIGTPRYMSPEQFTGESVDARSDVYSLGCVMYEMITGRSALTAADTTTKRTLRQPRLREDAPRALDAIIKRAMSRAPAERFQTAQQMQSALDSLLGALDRRHRTERRKAIRVGIGIAAVLVIAGVGWGIKSGQFGAHASTSIAAPASTVTAAPAPAVSSSVAPAPAPAHTVAALGAAPGATPKDPLLHPATVRAGSVVDRYLASVDSVVRSAWREALQSTTPNGSERATFTLLIGADGRVIHLTPVHLSDVPAYDEALGAAVQNIATFGPPPASLIGKGESVALRLVFQGSDVIVHAAEPTPESAAATTPGH